MDRLVEILTKELANYEDLLKFSQEKTDIIKEKKVEELDRIVKTEEEIVKEVISLEKERTALVKSICKSHGKGEKMVRIDELCEFVDENREELLDLRGKILSILKELKRLNTLNTALINNSLEYINFAIGLMTGEQQGATIYEVGGEHQRKGSSGLLDLKL